MAKVNLLVSACLLGTPCRYDGRSQEQRISLPEEVQIHLVCPEVLGGLPTPRLPCEIQGRRVINRAGEDCTEEFNKGAQISLKIAKKNNCRFALLKEFSPSCGVHKIYDGHFTGQKIKGQGITSAILRTNGIEVYSEKEIGKLIKAINLLKSYD